jgi:hypothetical protein
MDPVPEPLLLRKSGSVESRTRTSGSVARNSDQYTTDAVLFVCCKESLKVQFPHGNLTGFLA